MKTLRQLASSALYRSAAKIAELRPAASGLKVTWFEPWHPSLDAALQDIPEMETCPHDLFRLLGRNPTPARKRFALITKGDQPVAVVGVRHTAANRWELITNWYVPGALFPCVPEFLMPALAALPIELFVVAMRLPPPPHDHPLLRNILEVPDYRMAFSQDHEAYWRQTDYYKTVANARNHCRSFTVAVNSPGLAEWTIRNWEAKWRQQPDRPDASLSDRILAAQYLEARKLAFTIALFDGDKPIAAATTSVHGTSLVSGVIYRDPDYDRKKVGVRVIDAVFSFAVESGFRELDMGGDLHRRYKYRWAPQSGSRHEFVVCPPLLEKAKRVLHALHLPAPHNGELRAPGE